ncbi:MAG: baseplate J/gp47 family protein [Kineosporiaceae bacterium]
MPLPVPRLDDRDFAQLLAEAKALIAARSPQWSDLSPGDPGVTLLEAFAYLTDTLLYRVNKVPDKAFVQFLNLIGVRLGPPASASVEVTFSLATPATADVVVPRGARVTTARSGTDAPVFATVADAVVVAGQREASVLARHGDVVEAEAVGVGTGGPGQAYALARPPVTLPTGDDLDLVVGVEAVAGELDGRAPAREHGGRTYRIWTEVEHFGDPDPDADPHRYVCDRAAGTITFAPDAALAAVPGAGRAIRAWYRRGGGASGNVAAGLLTVLKDPVPGVEVTNRAAAAGGRDAEALEDAMVRGPRTLHTLDRVVTARDYEQFAVAASGGVSRARAVTRADLWVGATPGQVEVLLVPSLAATSATGVTADALAAAMTRPTLDGVSAALKERQPMGADLRVGWTGLKRVFVKADVVVHRAEDREAVRARLLERLARALSPVPVDGTRGRAFGEELRVATMYDVLQSERGVRWAGDVRLVVEDVPEATTAVVRDPHQPRTWFVASEHRVFRSVDDGDGWEVVGAFDGRAVERLAVLPGAPGVVVAVARVGQTEACELLASADYGDTWSMIAAFEFHVEDVAPARLDGVPHAFLATDQGLFRVALAPGATADRVLVAASDPAMACYAVTAVVDPSGALRVALAAQQLGGVFVSMDAGRPGTFMATGLTGVDIRLLKALELGNRRFVYAAAYATGDAEGAGVSRLELRGTEVDSQGWTPVGNGWTGGSCLDVALMGETVLAATSRAGVTVTSPRQQNGAWRSPTVESGLPQHDKGGFLPVTSVSVDAAPVAVAGGPRGVFRSTNGRTWERVSASEFSERVPLPPTWLFVGGAHELTVRYDDAR